MSVAFLLSASNAALGFWWHYIPQNPLFAFFALSSGILWALFVLLAEDNLFFYVVAAVSILLLGVGVHFDLWAGAGLAIGMVAALWAFVVARRAYNSNIKLSTQPIAGRSLRIYFTAIAIVFSLAYFGTVSGTSNISSNILPEEVFNIGMQFLENPLQTILPGVNPDSTVDEALAIFVQTQLKQSGMPNTSVPSLTQIRQMIPSQRKDIIRTLNKEFGTSIDVNTKGTEKLSTVLYRVSAHTIDDYAKRFSSYLPWIFLVGFFFSLKAISWVYYYVSIALAALLIKLLLSVGALKIERVPAEKEILK